MSLYGPRIELPEFPELPNIDFASLKKPLLGIALILIIIVLLYGMSSLFSSKGKDLFSNHIGINWVNNPLDLTKDGVYEAQLVLTLTNTTDELKDLTLEVTTDSEELIIFCPYSSFPNVASGNSRKTTCIVRRDPKIAIFSGSYTIKVVTNLGEKETTLNVVSN